MRDCGNGDFLSERCEVCGVPTRDDCGVADSMAQFYAGSAAMVELIISFVAVDHTKASRA
jgi:hypothetical protein